MLQHEYVDGGSTDVAAKTRRLQVLIEDAQWQRLERAAEDRGVSVASLVREAIETALPGGAAERRAAAGAVLGAPSMPVPDPAQLRDELQALRGRHA